MSRIETLLSLLKLFRASGGEVETRIRLQKEAYLLAVSNIAQFRVADFQYHHYGPYSRGLSDTLQYAVSSHLIDEERESTDDDSFTKYKYKLTLLGNKLASQAGKDDKRFVEMVNFLRKKNWRALELAATVKFLELNEGLRDRSAAVAQAMELKPATVPFKAEAEGVLDRLG